MMDDGDTSIPAEAWPSAGIVWDYMKLVHEPGPADAILCLGSQDVAPARHAAKLWFEGLAPYIVISGGIAHQGDLADTGWGRPEAEVLAEAAEACGVPRSALLLEDKATNTGENFSRSRDLVAARGLPRPRRLIVAAKPYMTRRGYATGRRVWPDVDLAMTCEAVDLADYLRRWENPALVLNLMVGDLQRLMIYSSRGFQIPQVVPDSVRAAYETLVSVGFCRHLVAAPGHPAGR